MCDLFGSFLICLIGLVDCREMLKLLVLRFTRLEKLDELLIGGLARDDDFHVLG